MQFAEVGVEKNGMLLYYIDNKRAKGGKKRFYEQSHHYCRRKGRCR